MTARAKLLDAVRRFALEHYARQDAAHDRTHGERVVVRAKHIAAAEGGDPFLVEAGAWLHQLHDEPERVEDFLASLPMEQGLRRRLVEIVRDCRPERIGAHASLEARIVFDSDALEVLGPYGTVRELLCNAEARGRKWTANVAATRAVQQLFRDHVTTRSGRRQATDACALMDRFWDRYDEAPEAGGGLPPIVVFVSPSGTGKTTLLEAVVKHLAAADTKVGVVKHHAHRVELDTPGKDTWRLRRAGATTTVLAGAEQIGVFDARGPVLPLRRIVEVFLASTDLVLAEGFRSSGEPAIWVRRGGAAPSPDWTPPENLLAVASDGPVGDACPRLDLNDPAAVAAFLRERFLR